MIAVDTNILIYSHRAEMSFHAVAVRRLRELVEGSEAWAIPWPCLHEFIAVVTNRRAFDPPTSLSGALEFAASLIRSPSVVLLSETDGHWAILRSLAEQGRTTGGQIHDTRIAALCLEHRVRVLWSADRDFTRFPSLTVVNPVL